MSRTDPVAYYYEAAVHCPDCAADRFGDSLDNPDTVDNEGNSLGVAAPWDEMPESGEYCNDCGEEIAAPWGA